MNEKAIEQAVDDYRQMERNAKRYEVLRAWVVAKHGETPEDVDAFVDAKINGA